MKAITVSVNYGDLLAITLPRNIEHFEEVLVISDKDDKETHDVVASIPKARLYITDAFYRNGATFNRGLAIEEGFDQLGRKGWVVMLDADVLLPPKNFIIQTLESTEGPWKHNHHVHHICSPWRRLLADVTQHNHYQDYTTWGQLPRVPDKSIAGYCQIFHADSEHIKNVRPWYGIHWKHVADCDTYFSRHFPKNHRIRLPFDVLHLGPIEMNWLGRVSPRADGRCNTVNVGKLDSIKEMKERRRKYKVGNPKRWEGELIE